jgi:hypothetical protein
MKEISTLLEPMFEGVSFREKEHEECYLFPEQDI